MRRWQSVWNSGARVQLLRAVLVRDGTFAELLSLCDGMSRMTGWNALTFLIECGYVTEDSVPHDGQRRSRATVFHAERATISADLVSVITWLAGGNL